MNLKEKKNNENKNLSNGIGNRGLKELICTTHGHELRGGVLEGWGAGWRGDKGGKMEKV